MPSKSWSRRIYETVMCNLSQKNKQLKFKYKISDWISFKNSYLRHKNLLSNSNIIFEELDSEIASISTNESEFNHWHLAEFGRFYGASIFRNNYELDLVESTKSIYKFEKPVKSKTILIDNIWKKTLEFRTFYLNCAEAYQTNVLANSLTKSGLDKLNAAYPDLNLSKGSFKTSNNYAYQILNDVLILISYNRTSNQCTIENLYKTEWNEK